MQSGEPASKSRNGAHGMQVESSPPPLLSSPLVCLSGRLSVLSDALWPDDTAAVSMAAAPQRGASESMNYVFT